MVQTSKQTMNKFKCIAIDDEPLAIEVIKSHIEKLDVFNIVGTFKNAMEATQTLSKEKIDLIFLDIQMPGMKGTDFLKNMLTPPKAILTTAYREYALEGYELDVIDYLLKPISFERFYRAINKFLVVMGGEKTAFPTEGMPEVPVQDFMYLNVNKKIYKIYFADIIYVESIRDYLTIHTSTEKLVVKHTLTALQEMLPAKEFFRIHRSFVVSLKHIKNFTANSVTLGITEIPIGKSFQNDFFRALNFPHFIQPED